MTAAAATAATVTSSRHQKQRCFGKKSTRNGLYPQYKTDSGQSPFTLIKLRNICFCNNNFNIQLWNNSIKRASPKTKVERHLVCAIQPHSNIELSHTPFFVCWCLRRNLVCLNLNLISFGAPKRQPRRTFAFKVSMEKPLLWPPFDIAIVLLLWSQTPPNVSSNKGRPIWVAKFGIHILY